MQAACFITCFRYQEAAHGDTASIFDPMKDGPVGGAPGSPKRPKIAIVAPDAHRFILNG